MLTDDGSKLLLAKRLFSDPERQDLIEAIAATNATASLLGRSRIRLRQQAALRRYAPAKFAELEAFCGGPGSGRPGPCPDPTKAKKPPATRTKKAPSKEETRGLIAKARAGKLDAAGARQLADGLSGMTVAELAAIKKEHGIAASGRKVELVKKLADRLREKANPAPPPPKAEKAKPAAKPEAKPRDVQPRQPGESNIAYLSRSNTAEAALTEEIASLEPKTDWTKLHDMRADLASRRNELRDAAFTKQGKPRALRGKDKDKIAAAQLEYQETVKKIDEINAAKSRTEEDVRRDVLKKIGVSVPSKIKLAAAPGQFGTDGVAREGSDWLSKVTNGRDLNVGVEVQSGARAHYWPTTELTEKHKLARRMVLDVAENQHTIVHELGHAIEDQHPEVGKAAREFLAHRVKDEPLTKMSVATGIKDYADHEVGRKDDFEKAFGKNAYYVGKHYDAGQTEVLSMGVEKLYQDPIGFAKADPEYFKFVLGVLHGNIK